LVRDIRSIAGNRRFLAAVLIALSVLLIAYLHYSTAYSSPPLHSICAELHYIPLLLAGLMFGFRGAVLTSLLVSVLYAAYILIDWPGASLWVLDNSLHIVFPAAFALLVGLLVDRERRHSRQLEKNLYLSGLGQATAILVHDLKNPLFIIKAVMRRLRHGKTGLPEAEGAIDEAVDRMERVMDGALDFAKPLELNRKEEDATALIGRLVQACTPKAEDEGITLTVDAPEQPLTLSADTVYLERALINLVNNAIEASQRGQEVVIRLLLRKEGATIEIRDHGKGMDKEALENVFVPFYSKKDRGTGLGMAVAKKIIEAHQGRITVGSRLGFGTEIGIDLPLVSPTNDG
jgi:signal transduction histidine kinase